MERFLFILAVTLVVLAGGAQRRRALLIIALALAAMLPVASFLAFDSANLLFDPLRLSRAAARRSPPGVTDQCLVASVCWIDFASNDMASSTSLVVMSSGGRKRRL